MSISEGHQGSKEFFQQVQGELKRFLERRLEEELEKEVEARLARGYHERRSKLKRRTGQAVCQRCGSRDLRQFSRNGHRSRQLVSQLGVLNFSLPRVVCDCGGSVKIAFRSVRAYERIGGDVQGQIEQWANWGVSLRQMQGELGRTCQTQVGLRYCNEQVQAYRLRPFQTLTSVPPVVLLDAIWLPLVQDSETHFQDKLGRWRVKKVGRKVCLLVAIGIYPQTGRNGVLAWQLADGETAAAWQAFCLSLEACGVYRQRGLELLIHDGGKGLCAALQQIYPQISQQRCLFHKLQNLWAAIQVPEHSSKQETKDFKRRLRHDLHLLYFQTERSQAEALKAAFQQAWADTQPNLIDCLNRDWDECLAFQRTLQRFPTWQTHFLRTTSLLERLNRQLRRLFRSAGAFHSSRGLFVCAARVLQPLALI